MYHLPTWTPGASAWIAAAALALAAAMAWLSDPGVSVTDDVAPTTVPAAAPHDPDFLAAQSAEWERWSGGPRGR